MSSLVFAKSLAHPALRLPIQRLLCRHGVPVCHRTDVHRRRHALPTAGGCRLITVAYIANQFPSSVESYVMDEIEELRLRNVRVICCSGKRVSVGDLEGRDREFWNETRFLQPLFR